ncbi:MAG TPA: SDR family oxidoreductase [Roseiflexaceae bacterium]|nr:SDR family oxidoreductase [Roseiflexaceae bacterium]HMP42655.1 SDR family oxidoreductase [Roseiflexaceae bacterium]
MARDRFLITGALGCIGAWVARNLVREGAPPVVFDLGSDPRRLKLLLTPEELAQITFISGDITDLELLEQALDAQQITHVIHLAALQVPFCRANPPLGARVNVVGTVNIFEAVARRRQRINRVVYASSAAVYDAADAGSDGAVRHGASGHPTTLYGVYKQANEGTARVYWQDQQISSIGLRPYIVYGVGRDQGMTSAPTRAMLAAATGRPFHIPFGGRADYHYADDVARAFIACARAPFEGAEIFNLSGSMATMSDLIAAVERVAPAARGTITFDDVALPFPQEYDAAPLAAVIGSIPHTPLDEAVAFTVERFRELAPTGIQLEL